MRTHIEQCEDKFQQEYKDTYTAAPARARHDEHFIFFFFKGICPLGQLQGFSFFFWRRAVILYRDMRTHIAV